MVIFHSYVTVNYQRVTIKHGDLTTWTAWTTWSTNSLDLKPQHEDFAFKPSVAKYGNVNKTWQHKFPILAQEIPLHMDMFHSHVRRSENENPAV